MNKIIFFLLLIITIAMPQKSLADGQLDTSFGQTGVVTTDIPGFNFTSVSGTYIQSDGKIVVVGNNTDDADIQTNLIVARYLTNGALDTTFGNNAGVAIINLSPTLVITQVTSNGVAVQSDGAIVIVGTVEYSSTPNNIMVARLTPLGALDTTFGTSAKPGVTIFPSFQVDSNDEGNAVVVDVDQAIVVVGQSADAMAIGRLTTNGDLDTTFNGTGHQFVQFAVDSEDLANAVALMADGKTIIAAGSSTDNAFTQQDFAFAVLNPNGTVAQKEVTLFSSASDYNTVNVTVAQSALVQPDGKIILIGWTDWANGGGYFALARYNTNYTLDTTFIGPTGALVSSINPHPNTGAFIAPSLTPSDGDAESSVAYAGGLQSDGKIVAGGVGPEVPPLDSNMFMVGRFETNGALDPSFTGNGGLAFPGFVYTLIGDSPDQINALALQGNGDIVTAGSSISPAQSGNDFEYFTAARYLVSNAPLTPATITVHPFATGLNLTGAAQNPSIVDLFIDGTGPSNYIGSTVTNGAYNTWSFNDPTPPATGMHTAIMVYRYRDDGHVNLQAETTFSPCDVIAASTGLTGCINETINGNLVPLVSGGTPPYTFLLSSGPMNGTGTVSATGLYNFTPITGFVGTGSFQFEATDTLACVSNPGTVDIRFQPCCPPTDPFFVLVEELYWGFSGI